MTTRLFLTIPRLLFVAIVALTLPSLAHAQSIAGVVRDASGAVLPGVTVEASSSALIEKTRSAVTDDRGQYQIIDLRPGAYKVTFSLAGFVLTPLGNAMSRHFEHEADVYGQEAIHGLVTDPQKTAVSSFNHLGEAWLDDPNPNGFVEFWSYSHPSVQHRAQFAERYDPWANGERGRFFPR